MLITSTIVPMVRQQHLDGLLLVVCNTTTNGQCCLCMLLLLLSGCRCWTPCLSEANFMHTAAHFYQYVQFTAMLKQGQIQWYTNLLVPCSTCCIMSQSRCGLPCVIAAVFHWHWFPACCSQRSVQHKACMLTTSAHSTASAVQCHPRMYFATQQMPLHVTMHVYVCLYFRP